MQLRIFAYLGNCFFVLCRDQLGGLIFNIESFRIYIYVQIGF